MEKEQIKLFDTHCHLDMPAFDGTRNEVLLQARKAGVVKFLIPGCGLFNWSKVEGLSSDYDNIYYSLGLHPHFIRQHKEAHLQQLEDKLAQRSEKCLAVGECGLDFYHSREDEAVQKKLFVRQIQLAHKFSLPLIIHSRKSHQDIVKLLKENKPDRGGVIHAFTGSIQQAMDYINLGFYIGVGGAITYPRARKTRNTIAALPLEKLVLETDAPDMPVFGCQGENNHPAQLKMILNELNMLRSEPEQTIASQVFENSKSMYMIC